MTLVVVTFSQPFSVSPLERRSIVCDAMALTSETNDPLGQMIEDELTYTCRPQRLYETGQQVTSSSAARMRFYDN